jgi:hypothetical protein
VLYLVIFGLVVAAAVIAAPMLLLDTTMRDLDRWWTARDLTTGWSRGADEA